MSIIFDEIGHTYTDDKTGKIEPSVTQILGVVYGTGLENAPAQFVKRAADKGTGIHKEIETYLCAGKQGETPEFLAWHEWFTRYTQPFTTYESEKIIHAQTPYGSFAGTLDFYGNGFIYDWKTCKTATRQQVAKWQKQLSFYAYAMRKMGYSVNEPLKIVHVNGNDLEVITCDYLGDEFVEETMHLYKEITEGRKTQQDAILSEQKELLTVSVKEMQLLEDTLLQIKALEMVAEDYRERIKAEMEQRGILDLQVGKVKMTYVPATVRAAFDSKAFKAEHADLYKQYIKETEVKPSLRITVK